MSSNPFFMGYRRWGP